LRNLKVPPKGEEILRKGDYYTGEGKLIGIINLTFWKGGILDVGKLGEKGRLPQGLKKGFYLRRRRIFPELSSIKPTKKEAPGEGGPGGFGGLRIRRKNWFSSKVGVRKEGLYFPKKGRARKETPFP